MIDVQVRGGAQARTRLLQIKRNLSHEMDRAVTETGLAGQRQAKINSSGRPGPRVRTGSHRRGIKLSKLLRVAKGVRRIIVSPSMVYSAALERGKHGVENVKAHTRRAPIRRAVGESKKSVRARQQAPGRGTVQVRAHSRKVNQTPRPYMRPAAEFLRRIVAPQKLRDAVRRAMRNG